MHRVTACSTAMRIPDPSLTVFCRGARARPAVSTKVPMLELW